jgi:hypothetical protein
VLNFMAFVLLRLIAESSDMSGYPAACAARW